MNETPEGRPRGGFRTRLTLCCGGCFQWLDCTDAGRSKRKGGRIAGVTGWRFTVLRGWLCPSCYARLARPLTNPERVVVEVLAKDNGIDVSSGDPPRAIRLLARRGFVGHSDGGTYWSLTEAGWDYVYAEGLLEKKED